MCLFICIWSRPLWREPQMSPSSEGVTAKAYLEGGDAWVLVPLKPGQYNQHDIALFVASGFSYLLRPSCLTIR